MTRLAGAIAEQIQSLNGAAPSAVFLAGGGSKLDGLGKKVAAGLGMDERRVAVAGNNFSKSAFSDQIQLDNPEYTTPLGIAISAGMGLLNDSYVVLLNGEPAKLFRSGSLSLRDVLLMNGYTYADMLGGTGKSLSVMVDGRNMMFRGEPSIPAMLRLNQEEVAINTPVHAGDSIQFIPAKKGADAKKQLRDVLDDGQGEEYLCQAVYGYILMNGLYGTKTDLKHLDLPELRACSYSMVRAKRIPHIKGTEEEAVRLAKRWGVDETTARRAAILHDCTKYLNLEEQLALCRKYGVELDELEQRAVKLLHSKTGACIAKYIFGEDEQVYQAIFWHTTGKADMSMLEKIIYLADYIEPTRDFDGVEPLRRLAYEDIDKALLMGMDMTIEEMKQRGNPVHRNTQAARDWLQDRGN